ncbi:helix-turn-helix domain-containing protein [Actinoplanes sp. NPDC020271]|uniref:helix-turn-helix domain-containing protein n=1 Tax=Actinoplanes sp. NPDC020271 TaxID=3363896 RepID=UPI0037BD56E1
MPLLRRVIGSVLRRVRQRQGRTLKEVAGAAGVSLPYLSEVERGTKEASSEVLAAICRALKLPMPDLLDLVREEMLREAAPIVAARRPVPVARISAPVPSRTPGATCSVLRLRSAAGRPRTRLTCARRLAHLTVTA